MKELFEDEINKGVEALNKKDCCYQCKGLDEFMCIDKGCDCHTVKATQPKQEWEEFLMEFCPKYHIWWVDNDNTKWNILNNSDALEALEAFASSQLSLSNKELAGRIEGMKHHYTNFEQRKRAMGWNEACDKIISLLNQNI